MAGLTKKEILTELKKIGINNSTELKSSLREYRQYYTPHSTKFPFSPFRLLHKIKRIQKIIG